MKFQAWCQMFIVTIGMIFIGFAAAFDGLCSNFLWSIIPGIILCSIGCWWSVRTLTHEECEKLASILMPAVSLLGIWCACCSAVRIFAYWDTKPIVSIVEVPFVFFYCKFAMEPRSIFESFRFRSAS